MARDIKWFLSFRFFTTIAMQMKMTILGYYLYQLSGEAITLGLIGLYEAIPRIGMALPAGYFVERMDKKKALLLVVGSYLTLTTCLYLCMTILKDNPTAIRHSIYIIVFLMGLVGSMGASASVSLFSLIIPRDQTAKYSAINSNAWQIGAVVGPIIGGFLLYQIGATNSILIIILFLAIGVFSVSNLPNKPSDSYQPFSFGHSMEQMKEGLSFVFSNRKLLWAISLDLFAVLFGGCVALLPIFATDILHVSSQGYGWLRAATSMGSVLSLLILARRPLHKNTGKWLLFSITMFGLCTIGFALSKIFILSLILLFLMGAFDGVSVVIRGALLLLETPDHMRARVSSVNSMFISSSNEIGAFESGFAAQYLGTVRSVVFGGCMTLLFVMIAWTKGKELVHYEFKDKK